MPILLLSSLFFANRELQPLALPQASQLPRPLLTTLSSFLLQLRFRVAFAQLFHVLISTIFRIQLRFLSVFAHLRLPILSVISLLQLPFPVLSVFFRLQLLFLCVFSHLQLPFLSVFSCLRFPFSNVFALLQPSGDQVLIHATLLALFP